MVQINKKLGNECFDGWKWGYLDRIWAKEAFWTLRDFFLLGIKKLSSKFSSNIPEKRASNIPKKRASKIPKKRASKIPENSRFLEKQL